MNNHEILAALEALDNLFSSSSRWTKDVMARSEESPIDPTDTKACSWCLLGGIEKVCSEKTPPGVNNYFLQSRVEDAIASTLRKTTNSFHIDIYNDRVATFPDIKRLIAQTKESINAPTP